MEDNEQLHEVVAHTKPSRDILLGKLIMAVNMGINFSITLIVGGQVVYGDLISGKDYCDEMSRIFAKADGDKSANEILGNIFSSLGDNYYTHENGANAPINFLHIKNVSYPMNNGGSLSVSNALLRVAVEQVSAFSLGRPE